MEIEMPNQVWEYTPTGQDWWQRDGGDAPPIVNASSRSKLPFSWIDASALTLLVCLALWCAHQFRAQRVHAAVAAAPPKFASFYNCEPPLPGNQPEQVDGDPSHTQFHPYNYTVCDGVPVTLWSAIR